MEETIDTGKMGHVAYGLGEVALENVDIPLQHVRPIHQFLSLYISVTLL